MIARDGVWQGAITWREVVKCSVMNTIRARDMQTQAAPTPNTVLDSFSQHTVRFTDYRLFAIHGSVLERQLNVLAEGGRQ